jgi:hypothetical protein
MRRDAPLDGLVEVQENVEPVRDLQRVRGAERGTLGIRPRPVPADHFYPWMRPQPGRQRRRFAAGQVIDGVVAFTVRDHGGIRVTATGGEIVHPDHPRRVELRIGQGHDPAQKRHAPRTEAQLGRNPSAGATGQCEPDVL